MSGLCDIACKMDFSFKSELLLARAICSMFVRRAVLVTHPQKNTHTPVVCSIF